MTDSTLVADEVTPEQHKRLRWALVLISLAQLMVVLDSTIANIALPFIGEDLSIDQANLSWIVTGTTGSRASMARRKRPPLNRPTPPSALRVPSGKTMRDRPSRTRRPMRFSTPAPGESRSTRRCPARRRCQPRNGKRPSDAFATMRSWPGIEAKTMGMS